MSTHQARPTCIELRAFVATFQQIRCVLTKRRTCEQKEYYGKIFLVVHDSPPELINIVHLTTPYPSLSPQPSSTGSSRRRSRRGPRDVKIMTKVGPGHLKIRHKAVTLDLQTISSTNGGHLCFQRLSNRRSRSLPVFCRVSCRLAFGRR